MLAVELDTPIDCVAVRADMSLELVDPPDSTVLVCRTPTEGDELLATYRCQSPVTRVEMRFRTVEGRYGTVTAYVLPVGGRSCQPVAYTVKPLSHVRRCIHTDTYFTKTDFRLVSEKLVCLRFVYCVAVCWCCSLQHTRLLQPPENLSELPLSELKLSGGFQLAEIHSWVVLCLPDIPEKYVLLVSVLCILLCRHTVAVC